VLALFHGGDADDAVKVVRRHDLDRVEVLFFFQQLAKVRIGRAALERAARTVARIVGLDGVSAHVATSGDRPLGARAPVGLSQQPAKIVQKPIGRPVAIADGVLAGVANGDDLNLGDRQQGGQFPQALSARADHGHGDLLAGSDCAGPTQDVSRDNGESSDSGGGSQELAATLVRSHFSSLESVAAMPRDGFESFKSSFRRTRMGVFYRRRPQCTMYVTISPPCQGLMIYDLRFMIYASRRKS
jgi:hypothetical protein